MTLMSPDITLAHQKYVLHGDQPDSLYPREKSILSAARAAGQEVITLNLGKLEPNAFTEQLQTTSLFGGNRCLYVIGWESLKSLNFKKQSVIELAASADAVVVTITKPMTAAQEKMWKDGGFTIEKHAVSPAVFQLVEAIGVAPLAKVHSLFRQALTESPSEWSLQFQLTRQVGLLLAAKTGAPIKDAPWKIKKAQSQATKLTMQQLVTFSNGLYDIERNFKSGKNKLPWDAQVEILLIRLSQA